MERAQSKTVYLAVAALLIVVIFSVGVAVFGGIIGTPNANTQKDTPTVKPVATNQISTETVASSSSLTPKPTLTDIPTPTPTYISSPRPTPTPWPTAGTPLTTTPYPRPSYDNFTIIILTLLRDTVSDPLRIRGYTDDGKALVFVINATAESEDSHQRLRQFNALATAYAYSVHAYHNETTGIPVEDVPLRLRIYEVDNTGAPPKTLHVKNTDVRMWVNGGLTTPEFHERYWATERNQTAQEQERVESIDRSAGNVTIWPNGTSTRESQ